MARRETITRNGLLEAAFAMAKEGKKNITARGLAARAGCSTQPIFRVFTGMEELERELFFKSALFFEEFYLAYPPKSSVPFVDLGLAYIQFAVENKGIFAMLFNSEKRYGKTLYDLINGESGVLSKEIAKAKAAGCKDSGELFMKMWILIHGSACMSLTGDYDLNGDDTKNLLEDSYKAFI